MKILLAYDGFEHSRPALEEAASVAAAAGAVGSVNVMSVVPPDARGSKSGGHVGFRPHAHEDVARAHNFLRARGVESAMKIMHGDAAAKILTEANEGAYDLVIVGTRKRGVVARALLGSVSAEVAKHAPCPVLVVGDGVRERIPSPAAVVC